MPLSSCDYFELSPLHTFILGTYHVPQMDSALGSYLSHKKTIILWIQDVIYPW